MRLVVTRPRLEGQLGVPDLLISQPPPQSCSEPAPLRKHDRLERAISAIYRGPGLDAVGFGRRYFGERAAFYSGLVMGTSAGTFLFTRVMVPEAIFALELTAIFYLFLRAWNGQPQPARRLLGRRRGDGARRPYARTDRHAVSPGRGFLLHSLHPQLGTLARASHFLQHADFPGDRGALALDRGTPLARISLVLFRQRTFQARARNPLPARL